MAYGIPPDKMTTEERLDEVAALLATGFLRLTMFSEQIPTSREDVVDLSPSPSVHANEK